MNEGMFNSYVLEYTEIDTGGEFLYKDMEVYGDCSIAKTRANLLKKLQYQNGERKCVTINLWGICNNTREMVFIKWWE